jgi:transcriptional regulator with XRE-family HTH domain
VIQPDPAIWDEPDMRQKLTARDIAGVFKLLQQRGMSQRTIASLADMSQSEVSEVINDFRLVQTYNTFLRICEGLGIPRGYMGWRTLKTSSSRRTP